MRFLFTLFCFLPAAFAQTLSLFGFLPNQGQFPPAVRFVRYSSNFFYLTRDSFVLPNGIRVQIADIDPNAGLIGGSPGNAIYNFYQGRDSSHRMTGLRSFEEANLKNAYPGVNAAFITSPGQGKAIFTIAPLADPTRIRLRVLNTGATPFQGAGRHPVRRGYRPWRLHRISSSHTAQRSSGDAGDVQFEDRIR